MSKPKKKLESQFVISKGKQTKEKAEDSINDLERKEQTKEKTEVSKSDFKKNEEKKRSRKAASSRRRCRKNGPGLKQGLCHLIEGLRLASGSEKFLLDQLVTLELQLHQFRITFLFLRLLEVN